MRIVVGQETVSIVLYQLLNIVHNHFVKQFIVHVLRLESVIGESFVRWSLGSISSVQAS
jgi:hypothetical protein